VGYFSKKMTKNNKKIIIFKRLTEKNKKISLIWDFTIVNSITMANKDQRSLESIYHKILIREFANDETPDMEETPEAPVEAEGHSVDSGALKHALQGLGWLGSGEELDAEQLKAIEDAVKGISDEDHVGKDVEDSEAEYLKSLGGSDEEI
jgi:hypothetical protein